MGSGQRENGASAPTSVSYRFVRMRRTEERWGFRCGDRRHAEIDCGNKNRCDLDGRFDIRGFLASRSYPCVWVVRANAEAAGLPDATPAAIMQILKSRKMVSAVVGPEEARPLEEVGRPAYHVSRTRCSGPAPPCFRTATMFRSACPACSTNPGPTSCIWASVPT